MRWIGAMIDLPLVGKELVEQASKLRTYLLRVIYAVLLFSVFMIVFHNEVGGVDRTRADILSSGKTIFMILVNLQILGIVIFLPGMVAGAIPMERERGALELLLITRMSPMAIILQKLISRILPMLTFLMLALPLMAMTMTLGGVSWLDLLDAAVLLILICVQVAVLSMIFSAACQTTMMSIILTYITIFMVGMTCLPCLGFAVVGYGFGGGTSLVGDLIIRAIRLGMIGAVTLVILVLGLVLSRHFLLTRRMVREQSASVEAMRSLDRYMDGVNKKFGGVNFIKNRGSLPEDDPIVWRATSSKSLGNWRYLGRFALLIWGLTVLVCYPVLYLREMDASGLLMGIFVVIWPLLVLVIAMMANNLFSSEKAGQTLEPLLTTPISTQQLIRGKLTTIRRILFCIGVPYFLMLITYIISAGPWSGQMSYRSSGIDSWWYYPLVIGLGFWVYLGVTIWVSMLIGLACRSRAVSTLRVLGLLMLWGCGPLLLGFFMAYLQFNEVITGMTIMMSPMALISFASMFELNDYVFGYAEPALIIHFTIYAAIWIGARIYVMRHANRLLGRA